MQFKNFSIWRGRLPHWRADDVTYYVTFRHRRPLDPRERQVLLQALYRLHNSARVLRLICVLPETTEMLLDMKPEAGPKDREFSKDLEAAKNRAGKQIAKKAGETFTPFYQESFDRIMRDEAELNERWTAIHESPAREGLAGEGEDYEALASLGGD